MALKSYVIISPVRNEAECLERTIRSVIEQSALPVEYVLVNDGSTDGTEEIIQRYSAEYPWIRLVSRMDRGYRKTGAGVVEAFYDGLTSLRAVNWDFLVKLDGDVQLGSEYFAQMLAHFAAMPRLGIGGGFSYYEAEGLPVREWVTENHVRGAVKMYRRACWEAIGGLMCVLGWDVLDEVTARMAGWETRSFEHPHFILNRKTGGPVGLLRTRQRDGYFAWYRGSAALYVLLRGIRRLFDRPYLIGGLTILGSYWFYRLKGTPQIEDAALRDFVRQEQLAYLRSVPKLLLQGRLF